MLATRDPIGEGVSERSQPERLEEDGPRLSKRAWAQSHNAYQRYEETKGRTHLGVCVGGTVCMEDHHHNLSDGGGAVG